MSTCPFSINLKRIIAIDSAGFAYVEVPLNGNLVLLGTGNLGKSSVVNAVRFFFLPDINVNHADKKFGFLSGSSNSESSYYTKDQIWNHYFPTQHSKLVLEVEHKLVDGTTRQHCQIISQGSNYRLNRIFCPEPYENIQHLFWNKQGIAGERPEKNAGDRILGLLKTIQSSTKQINQVEQLTEALYHVDILRPDLCPFVIFPIKDIDAQSVNSIRALIKMLFNQDGSSLRLMSSAAIEASLTNEEKLEMDIGELINEQKALKLRKEKLNKLKAAEPRFMALKNQYARLLEEKDAAIRFAERFLSTIKVKSDLEQENIQLGKKRAQLEEKLNSHKRDVTKAENDIYSHKKRLKEISTHLIRNSEHLKKCELICSEFPKNTSVAEVLDMLKGDLEDKKIELEQYTDQNARNMRIAQLEEFINTKNGEIDTLKRKIENETFQLVNQIDKEAWEVLLSINPVLGNANPGRPLLDEEVTSILQFTSLFKATGTRLAFFDEWFEKITQYDSNSPEKELDDKEAELNAYMRELNNLNGMSGEQTINITNKIKIKQKEIDALKSDIPALENYEYVNKQTAELKEEERLKASELFTLEESHALLVEIQTRFFDEANDIKKQHDKEQKVIQKLDALIERYAMHIERFDVLKQALAEHQSSNGDNLYEAATEEEMTSLVKSLEASENAKTTIKDELKNMMYEGLVDDTYGLLEGKQSGEAIKNTFTSLSDQFSLLDKNLEILSHDTSTHNSLVRSRLERLNKTKEKIALTLQRINSDLANAKVNDLEAVRLSLTLNAHFEDLIQSWIEFDDLGDSTLPEAWYTRLKEFLHSDAINQQDGKLRMDNIIQAARYETKKVDAPWDQKDQSNSTKMLINMHLCDIFIQKLSSETSHIAFPLIMDEVGSVSEEQFPDLMKGLNNKGHWLIGVTTHGKSGELIAKFTQHLVMDEAKTSKPYSKSRRNVCYPIDLDRTERLIVKEQGSLLEHI